MIQGRGSLFFSLAQSIRSFILFSNFCLYLGYAYTLCPYPYKLSHFKTQDFASQCPAPEPEPGKFIRSFCQLLHTPSIARPFKAGRQKKRKGIKEGKD